MSTILSVNNNLSKLPYVIRLWLSQHVLKAGRFRVNLLKALLEAIPKQASDIDGASDVNSVFFEHELCTI